MAKRRHESDRDTPTDPREMEVPAAEATPAEGDETASVEGGTPRGTPQYPPPASDRSGERTANVPPSKQLPTGAPPEENPPGRQAPPTVEEAIRARDAYLAELEAENADFRRRLGLPPRGAEPQRDAGPTRKAVVRYPGSHVGDVEVAIPEGTPEDQREAAAVAAAQQKAGIWSAPTRPVVTYPEG
jgi:hypothetical protein